MAVLVLMPPLLSAHAIRVVPWTVLAISLYFEGFAGKRRVGHVLLGTVCIWRPCVSRRFVLAITGPVGATVPRCCVGAAYILMACPVVLLM